MMCDLFLRARLLLTWMAQKRNCKRNVGHEQPKEIYERLPQKYLGGTRTIKEIIRTLELLGEYENGSQLPTKNSNKC